MHNLSDFHGAGSIIKPLKIACYCGGKQSYVEGMILFIEVYSSSFFLPPQ